MTKLLSVAAASLLTTGLAATAFAAPPMMHGKMKPAKMGKMVSLYQADKCHMYFTPAQAKKYNYACPDSKGKMKMVKVSSAMAKTEIAKTTKELAPKKTM